MTRRAVPLPVMVLAVAALAACASIPRNLAPVQPRVVSLEMLEAGFEGQRFAVELALTNPNTADLPVRRLEFELRLAGEGLISGDSPVRFMLPGAGSETVRVEVFSRTVSSVSRLASLAEGPRNELGYELQGRLTLDAGLRDPLPISARGQVPLTVRSASP